MVFIKEPSSLEAVKDATQLAFYGEDFQIVPQEEPVDIETQTVVASSGRVKVAYDTSAGSMVEIVEFHMLLHDKKKGVTYPEHRIYTKWDTGESYEIELDSGEVIQEDGEADIIRTKVVRALGAATSIL
jgi:hypothetical protein